MSLIIKGGKEINLQITMKDLVGAFFLKLADTKNKGE